MMKNWQRLSGFMPSALVLAALGMADVSLAATPQVKAGENHTVMLRSNGSIWACGDNQLGQLGDGTTTARAVPTRIGTATDWVAIAGGEHHTLALRAVGAATDCANGCTLWAWGDNTYGQLGIGAAPADLVKTAPVQVGTDVNWKAIAAGDYHSLAMKTNGTLWAWGDSADGALGTGETYSGIILAAPTQVGVDTDWAAMAAGPDHTIAVKTDGTLWGWGANGVGQLGDQTNLEGRNPVRSGADSDWADVAARGDQTLAIKKDKRLFAFGLNADGQLGDGTFANKDLPTLVNADVNWSKIATGKGHTVALKTDGSLWTWGSDVNGQLGDGIVGDNRSTPLRVGNATHWVAIDAGENHTIALTDEGTIWSMGDNTFGQLCDGSTAAKAAPTADISPLSGDIDQDGSVGIADAVKALRISIGIAAQSPLDVISGDVGPLAANLPAPDGNVTLSDAVIILRKVIGLVSF